MIRLSLTLADLNVATTKSIGIFGFSVQLAQQLAQRSELERLTLFGNRTLADRLHSTGRTVFEEHNAASRSRLARIFWDQWGVYSAARRTGNEWLLLPKGFASFMRRCRVKLAAYVHDIMGEYYHHRYPRFEPRLEYLYFTHSLNATLRQARVIFTNSQFSRTEIQRLAAARGLPEPRIVVASYGFEEERFSPERKENRVLLFVSKVPHKRTDLAIQFVDHWLRRSRFDGQIDCIGIVDEAPRLSARWNWIGRVSPPQAREMMRRSRAMLYFSEYEGFGMPPVEAVLNGTCPVYSDIPVLREVMRGTGFAFSNSSAEEFGMAMEKALTTSAETTAAWSKQLLAVHNWPKVTDQILSGLQDAKA